MTQKYTMGERLVGFICRSLGRVPLSEVQVLSLGRYLPQGFYQEQLERMEDLYGFRLDSPERRRATCA